MSATVLEAWYLYNDLVLESLTKKEQATEISRWENYLKPKFAAQKLSQVRTLHVLKFRRELEQKDLSQQTVYHCLSLLRRIMRKALLLELYEGKLPLFNMPRFDNKRVRYLTKTEAQVLLRRLKEESPLWYDISLFALYTGLRAGEIFKLQKSHVNFFNRTIHVFDTKNNTTRTVPLNKAAQSALLRNLPKEPEGLFFCQQNSKPITEVSNLFRRVLKVCNFNFGITDRRNKVVFHTLRHTFASWLVQAGTPLVVVGALLGHKTAAMTQRYAHLCPSQALKAIETLPAFSEHCK